VLLEICFGSALFLIAVGTLYGVTRYAEYGCIWRPRSLKYLPLTRR